MQSIKFIIIVTISYADFLFTNKHSGPQQNGEL